MLLWQMLLWPPPHKNLHRVLEGQLQQLLCAAPITLWQDTGSAHRPPRVTDPWPRVRRSVGQGSAAAGQLSLPRPVLNHSISHKNGSQSATASGPGMKSCLALGAGVPLQTAGRWSSGTWRTPSAGCGGTTWPPRKTTWSVNPLSPPPHILLCHGGEPVGALGFRPPGAYKGFSAPSPGPPGAPAQAVWPPRLCSGQGLCGGHLQQDLPHLPGVRQAHSREAPGHPQGARNFG